MAYEQLLAHQDREVARSMRRRLAAMRSQLKTRLAKLNAELAGRPNDGDLLGRRDTLAARPSQIESQFDYPDVAAS